MIFFRDHEISYLIPEVIPNTLLESIPELSDHCETRRVDPVLSCESVNTSVDHPTIFVEKRPFVKRLAPVYDPVEVYTRFPK